nr:MAG TPA: RfbF-like protein [Caudoviricetes sp.]
MRSDFCAFVLTHGRPDNVKTLKALKKCGYTGDVVIVIDNEDDRAAEYYERFGDMVYMFDKLAVSRTFDSADQSKDRRTIVYARNACFDIARELGYRYFIELDDDYSDFMHRFEYDGRLGYTSTKRLDEVIEKFIEFLDESGALTVAFAQGGDMIGGLGNGNFHKGLLRKAMNSFICDVNRHFKFVGRINEDVNTYVLYGSRGGVFFTYSRFQLNQGQTQKNKGGMTDVYDESGTYVKSFYTVMMHPSSVYVAEMGDKHMRLHHHVKWEQTVPKIIRECIKKS